MHHFRLSIRLLLLLCITFSIPGLSCGGSKSSGSSSAPQLKFRIATPYTVDSPGKTTTETASKKEGLTLKKEGVALVVPPGAVKSDTEITVKEFSEAPVTQSFPTSGTPPAPAVYIGKIYDLGPEGIDFDKPVKVTLPYDKSILKPEVEAKEIALAYWNGKSWIVAGGSADTKKGTVTASVTGFPGILVTEILAAAAAGSAIGAAIWKFGDEVTKGQAYQHIMPQNEVVKQNIKTAGFRIPSSGPWVPLEDPQRPGKLNRAILPSKGIKSRFIKYWDGQGHVANAAEWSYAEKDASGKDTNFTKPDVFFKNGRKGDCTCWANATTSMLRNLGVEAYSVAGYYYSGDGLTGWGPHAWVEFVYEGKVYYCDNNEGLTTREEVKNRLWIPKSLIGSGDRWNEEGQRPYVEGWWWKEGYEDAPWIRIETPGKEGPVHSPCTFTVKSANIPKGARLEWYFVAGANESGTKYTDKTTVSHTFKSPGQKTLWAQYVKGDDPQPIAYDEVRFTAKDCWVEIKGPRKGVVDQEYTFIADPTNIPNQASLEWYVDNSLHDRVSSSIKKSFGSPGDYKIKARYMLGNDPNPVAENELTITIEISPKPATPAQPEAEPVPAPAPTPAPSPAPTPTPPASGDSGGGWYQDGSVQVNSNVDEPSNSNCYFGYFLTPGSGSCSAGWSYKEAGCTRKEGGCSGSATGSVSWAPPPASLVPGNTINFNLSAQASAGACGLNNTSYISVYVSNEKIGTANTSTNTPTSAAPWRVPTGSEGSKLTIEVNAYPANMQRGAHCYYNYIYKSSGTPPASPSTTTQPAQTGGGNIEGTWSANANNYPGKLEFSQTTSGWTGRVNYDVHNTWETLKNVSYNAQTGQLSFYRENGNQTYTGTVSNNSISGTFTSAGASGYIWSATR